MEVQNQWTSVTRGARALVLTTTRNCKNAIDFKRQGIMHMNAVPRARYHVPKETTTAKWPNEVRGVGPTLLQKRNNVTDSQKTVGFSRCYAPTDPTTSSGFAGLLTKDAPNTQPLCVAASGNEVSLITLKHEVTQGMSLRALVGGVEQLCTTPIAGQNRTRIC